MAPENSSLLGGISPRRRYKLLADQVILAEQLAQEQGGSLRVTDLKADYPTLVSAIYRHPESFAHINLLKRQSPGSREAYMQAARDLAALNGGVLPAHVDLLRIDPKLSYYIANHKEEFAGFERGHTAARMERITSAVAEAECLAAASGGELFISKEFHAQHNKLVLTMRRYPEYFVHIPRRRRNIVALNARVKEAEALAAANGGVLPHQGVLRRDYESLRTAMTKNPEAFKHIPRQVKRRNSHDLVVRAEAIAAANNGVLPHASALEKIDHSLAITIYRRPELFGHLRQEVRDSKGHLLMVRELATQKLEEQAV